MRAFFVVCVIISAFATDLSYPAYRGNTMGQFIAEIQLTVEPHDMARLPTELIAHHKVTMDREQNGTTAAADEVLNKRARCANSARRPALGVVDVVGSTALVDHVQQGGA